MKKRLLFIVMLVLGLAFFFFSSNDTLKDNFYEAINREVILENRLEDGEYSWSYFLEAQDRVDEDTDLLVKDILKGNASELDDKEIETIMKIYNKALDMDKRNSDGLKAIDPYLEAVWDVETAYELVDVIILIENELGIDLLSNMEIIQDYQDNSKNIIYFAPVTFAFGISSDYIVNDDYMAYKAYIRRACIQLWKAYGLEAKEAREVVSRVFAFYVGVAGASKLGEELSDIESYYNVVSEDEVNGIYSNVSGEYLERIGLDGKDVYSLVDKGQYEYLNASLVEDNLGVWKEVIVTKILSSYASYLSCDYVEVVSDLNESLLGSKEELSSEEKAYELVSNLFSEEIDKVYADKYLDSSKVKDIENIFEDIKKVFESRLKNNNWLSELAKEKALIKLEKMEIIIGIDDEVSVYGIAKNLRVSNNSFISDIIAMQQMVSREDLKRLDSGEKIGLVSQTEVNAYYQPLDNSIVIPVAFLELVDVESSYYEKLGTIGMIIAHEVTHAFDGNGAMFDENGNLSNWWSSGDEDVFNELKNEVSEYYSKYEVIAGKYIDGEKTVNENIADLGGVVCIVDIALDNKAKEEDFRIMFSALADIWASVESDDYMKLLLLQDVHAPNEFRVNAVLSSIDEFYQVYDIYPWHEMWIDRDDRIMVW